MLSTHVFSSLLVSLVVCVDAVDEFTRPSHVSGLPIIALSLSPLMLPLSPSLHLLVSESPVLLF